MEQIENYIILPHGRAKDLTGEVFGDFKVLYRTIPPENVANNGGAYWLCQCKQCNNYFIKKGSSLIKGKNYCNCKYDLTGKQIGRWTVMYLSDKKTKKRGRIYHCKCACGNEKDVSAETLSRGQSRSCGCLNKELAAERCRQGRLNLTGQRYGKLIALYPIYSGNEYQHTKWHCKCDCGNECDIDMGNLRSGKSQSCGCTQSKQEEKIIKLLTSNKIPFTYQKTFSDLLNKQFDFFIQLNSNSYIIEYDGSQHFSYTGTGWDTKEHFERTRKSDLIKNKYCFEHNIPLIRIPYNENYDLNDLKIETSRFLLTPENEKDYYNRE